MMGGLGSSLKPKLAIGSVREQDTSPVKDKNADMEMSCDLNPVLIRSKPPNCKLQLSSKGHAIVQID